MLSSNILSYIALLSAPFFAVVEPVAAQTNTHCNPLKEKCEPNPALGKSIFMDFANDGPHKSMRSIGSATLVYDDQDGGVFSVKEPGHNPTLQSKFYIMFGRVSVVAKAAPGAGIVSSIVLLSDDLDEIDFEFVGNDDRRVQTNYFSKGDTSTYDRGQYHNVPGGKATEEFHAYTIEWNASAIKWYLDGQLVRSLQSVTRPDIFPQTPMTVRVGAWTAGDPRFNQPGTIEWAGGPVDYSAGPFIYAVKSISVDDYSTGTSYEYTDNSGEWSSIKSNNGQIGATGPVSQKWFKKFMKISRPM